MDVALMTDKEIREEIKRLKAVLLDRYQNATSAAEHGHVLPFAGDRCLRCDAQFFPDGGWRGEDCATRLLRAVERMTNSGEIGTGPYLQCQVCGMGHRQHLKNCPMAAVGKSADDLAEEESQRSQDEHEASLHPRERW